MDGPVTARAQVAPSNAARTAQEARAWLFEKALPFWWEFGIDRETGGFHDLLEHDGRPIAFGKRSFVQARQIFVFAEAGRLGWSGPWRTAVESGLRTLLDGCRHPDGGFVHRLACGSQRSQSARDLYDQAFALFGLSHAARTLGDRRLLDEARAHLVWLRANWSLREGFRNGDSAPDQFLQNPHMHLLEAAMALGGQDGETLAADLAKLFAIRFLDTAGGHLPERFDAQWRPLQNDQWCEPGHHFEWTWLLFRLHEFSGRDLRREARQLHSFGQRFGIDRTRNVAVDRVSTDGSALLGTARLWPQAERLRAAVALASAGDAAAVDEIEAAWRGLTPFLDTSQPGTFHDAMRVDGMFAQAPVRASSLYHLTGAIVALMEFAGYAPMPRSAGCSADD